MRAIVHQAPCTAGDLSLQDLPLPSFSSTQLLVKVAAAGVNRADIVQRQGRYPAPAGASPLLGLEIAGEVIAVGEAVTDFAIGDAVFGLIGGGGETSANAHEDNTQLNNTNNFLYCIRSHPFYSLLFASFVGLFWQRNNHSCPSRPAIR